MQLKSNGTPTTTGADSPATRGKDDGSTGGPDTSTIVDIVVGSHFKKHALRSDADDVLIFETTESALQHSSARVSVRHMRPDETAGAFSHIPSRNDEEAGRDGAALDSSYSRKIVLSKYDQYRRLIERKIDGADLVWLDISSGGGTGTGTEDFFRKILREAQFDGRIIARHHISPNVRRRKMTMALKGLLFEKKDGNEIFDVLVRDEDNIQEIQRIDPAIWAEVEALISNIHGVESHTDLDLRQIQTLRVDHDRFVDDITFDIVARSAPTQLKHGSRGGHEREKHRREAEKRLEKIATLSAPLRLGMVEGIGAAAGEGTQALESAIEEQLDTLIENDLDRVDDLLGRLTDHVQIVGRSGLGVEEIVKEVRSRRDELDERLAEMNRDDRIERLSKSRSMIGRWAGVFGGRDSDPLVEMKEYVVDCHARRVNDYIATRLSEELLPPDSAFREGFNHEREHGYRLADDSELRPRLIDEYFASGSHHQGIENVRRRARELLPELFNEVFRDRLHDALDLGFATRHPQKAKGAVVRSSFADEVDLRALDLDPSHVTCVHEAGNGVTAILQFKVSKRLADVPALRDMVQLVEDRARKNEDRRPYLRTAAEIWPLPLFEVPGEVDPATARLILAKAYATTDALRAESECVRVRKIDNMVRYTDFREFRERLTPRQAHRLHHEFWNGEFARDRSGCISRLGRLAEGETHDGRQTQRFRRLKNFVGATDWKESITELHRRAKAAGSAEYWEE
jgi:hypothetical protein